MKKKALLVKLAEKNEPTQQVLANACTANSFLMGFQLYELSKTFQGKDFTIENETKDDNFIVLKKKK
jgi:hypothetical protein